MWLGGGWRRFSAQLITLKHSMSDFDAISDAEDEVVN